MYEWVPIEIEQALPLLSGLFSLNSVYTHMRVVQNMNDDVKKRFKEIRAHAVKSLDKVPADKLELYML
jgi:hypothetical protein